MTLLPGARLGPFEIRRLLGTGGMGEVYLAHDSRLDRDVALKILPQEFAADEERLKRFLVEARAASSLSSPHVAHIYEIGESEGTRFIVMEYVAGEPLNRVIEGKPAPPADVVEIALQIADALDEAHQKGIIHRDIKPANVIVTARGQAKVLDFGLAKLAHDQLAEAETILGAGTAVGMVLGTLHYMSPEQVLGRQIDARTDIFSLGVLLYEMAAGRLPFVGATATDTIFRITNEEPDAIPRFNYRIPAELERVVRKCLEKDSRRRYQTARDLIVDLRNLKRDSDAPATVIMSATRLSLKRRRLAIAAALVATVALFATLGVRFWPSRELIESIAVLPVVSSGNDLAALDLSEGIASRLINNLSQLPNLNVAPPAIVRRYFKAETDPRQAAADLAVHAVLLVQVARRGDSIALDLELLDATHNRHVWSERYTRAVAELPQVQEQIVEDISEQLRLSLSAEERGKLEVYKLYERGRAAASRRKPADLRRAIEYFQQAIQKDRQYARAYAGMAECFNLLGIYNAMPAREAFENARKAARRALDIDETLAEAHTSLAYVRFRWDWNWDDSRREFERANELNPDAASSHYWYTFLLTARGDFDGALQEAQAAQAADPISAVMATAGSWSFFMSRRFEDALSAAKKAISLDPGNFVAHRHLGLVYAHMKKYAEAFAALEQAERLSDGQTLVKAELGYAYALAGNHTTALRVLSELETLHRTKNVSPYEFSVLLAALGRTELALQWLDRGTTARDPQLVYLKVDPRFDTLRGHPRFDELVRRVDVGE